MNRIITESGLILGNDKIVDGNLRLFESMTGNELAYDTFEITLEGDLFKVAFKDKNGKQVYTSDGKKFMLDATRTWKYGRWLKYFHDDELIGKFYIEKFTRIGKKRYKITAISSVGLLANSNHYGGIYQAKKFIDLVTEVIGGQIPFSVDITLANQLMYGWLPIATRRENLHQILFAMSASIKKDANGDMFITALSKDTAKGIPDSRIFQGGSIEYPQANKAIALSEHAYIARNTDEVVTLYNAEIPADSITTPLGIVVLGGLVLFDEPCHDLEITGANIIESGVNYAVLSPTGECILTGKKYAHTVREVTRPEVLEGQTDENIVNIPSATLVSIANSEGVADRLARYYGSAKTVKMDILQGEERTGDCVSFNDPFDEASEGLISELDMTISGILRSTAKIITDYDPPDIGNFYSHVQLLTGSTTWTIPEGTEKIRVVLIGGGSSGHKGENGADGIDGYNANRQSYFPPGGNAGAAGSGGKILIKTLNVEGIASLSVSCGAGNSQGNGQEGGNTTLTISGDTYTSADGTSSSIGFVEIFGGNSYGLPGIPNNTKGGRGGCPKSSAEMPGEDFTDGVNTWYGGARGAYAEWTNQAGQHMERSGGCGGGAAHGMDGESGHDGRYDHLGRTAGEGGKGGDGDNGANADPTIYGMGGQGGYGGGGGGCGQREWADGKEWTIALPSGGAGGQGGLGGHGAAGCVFIYYND